MQSTSIISVLVMNRDKMRGYVLVLCIITARVSEGSFCFIDCQMYNIVDAVQNGSMILTIMVRCGY